MDSTVAVQTKGFGFSFQAARNSVIAFSRSSTLPKEPRRIRLLEDLEKAITEFLAAWNENPKPFVWTATVESIVAKLSRCRQNLETIQPGCTRPGLEKNLNYCDSQMSHTNVCHEHERRND